MPDERGGRVRLMPDDLADQIAAGEVVERPASAVKELVENALDADARRIRVELEEGGLGLIRVTDDGSGMNRHDAELCVRRHATSKVATRADLFAISTLGFRGEALPSIASVSRFSLLTKERGAIGGTRVVIEGGRTAEIADAGAPPGTEVTVRDLFYNTPARLKFLKSRATELKHVVEAVQHIALANPGVGFTLAHNGRTVIDLPPVEAASDRVFALFGEKDARSIHPLEPAEQDGVACTGFFGVPTLTRRTTSGVLAYVNGRFVRDKTVMGAVRVGYQGMIDKGRYPVVVLFLDVPPGAVDVNVHPAKTEVRFHASEAVFRAVRRAIANSLSGSSWVPGRGASRIQPLVDGAREAWRGEPGATPSAQPPFGPRAPRSGAFGAGRAGARGPTSPGSGEQVGLPVREYVLHDGRTDAHRRGELPGPAVGGGSAGGAAGSSSASSPGRLGDAPAGYFASLHYIGHFRGTYLLASDGTQLVVVDQHAAHERITFEALRIAWRDRRYDRQPLLVPRILSLDAVRAATLGDNIEFFEALGFELEPFGGNDFALKAAPAVLRSAQHEALVVDALDELADDGTSGRVDEAIDAVLVRMACHGSVRAGDTLSVDEVYALYRQLDAVDFGANCPHGRPVWFTMSLEEIETRFDRR